jgi:hypothetical protein
MKRILVQAGLAGFVTIFTAGLSFGQGQAPKQAPTQPSQPSGNTSTRTTTPPPSSQNPGMPMYVDGQIIDETGKPMTRSVSVQLNCGVRSVEMIHPDLKGYFHFTLGAGIQANTDFSAADSGPDSSMLGGGGLDPTGGFNGMGGGFSSNLTGCEIRVAAPGYRTLMRPITDPATLGTIDLGTLQLYRTTSVAPGAVSVSSLLVPNKARKEFDQGVKDLQNNHVPQATQHLEKAVDLYDKYAEAWNELGRAYALNHDQAKARDSYGKAIAADSKFAPPYVGLAALQLEAQDYESAAETIDNGAAIDPAVRSGVGGYIEGFANYRLNRLDAAEQDLLQAEKGPHQSIPQLHAVFADIYMQKQDMASAAAQIRAYLKEAPDGPFAAEMRKDLDLMDKAASNAGGSSEPATVAP